jgi:tRNA(Ile)-lysidine synthetase-like protein
MRKDLEKSIDLVNQVRIILKRLNALTTNKATMLAISGGQDSACLIAIAVQMRDQWKGPFGIISCNHLWQPDSFYGLDHVCRLAFLVDRPLYFVVAPFAVFNEANARSWRYNTIQRIGDFYHFSTICTGHTASDRVETILFNFVRGSGIRGLSSLGWNRWFISNYPNQYHSTNFKGTASHQSSAFFDPTPPPFEPRAWSEAMWPLSLHCSAMQCRGWPWGQGPPTHAKQPQGLLSLKVFNLKYGVLIKKLSQEEVPLK